MLPLSMIESIIHTIFPWFCVWQVVHSWWGEETSGNRLTGDHVMAAGGRSQPSAPRTFGDTSFNLWTFGDIGYYWYISEETNQRVCTFGDTTCLMYSFGRPCSCELLIPILFQKFWKENFGKEVCRPRSWKFQWTATMRGNKCLRGGGCGPLLMVDSPPAAALVYS